MVSVTNLLKRSINFLLRTSLLSTENGFALKLPPQSGKNSKVTPFCHFHPQLPIQQLSTDPRRRHQNDSPLLLTFTALIQNKHTFFFFFLHIFIYIYKISLRRLQTHTLYCRNIIILNSLAHFSNFKILCHFLPSLAPKPVKLKFWSLFGLLHIGKLSAHCRINYSAIAIPDQPPLLTFYSRIISGNLVSRFLKKGTSIPGQGVILISAGTPVAGLVTIPW